MVLKEPEPGFYQKNLVFTFGSQGNFQNGSHCEPSKIQKVSIYEGRVTLLRGQVELPLKPLKKRGFLI